MAFNSVITVTLNAAVDRVLESPGFAIGGHQRARELARYPGGKGINVSRVLGRLRCDNIATGFVGQDMAPFFEEGLEEAGPGRSVCQLLSARGRTRENITILDPPSHTDTHIRTDGYALTRNDVQRIVSKLGLLVRPDATVVFAGSLPQGMDKADLDTLIYVALGGGARVTMDVGGDLLTQCTSLDLGVAGDAEKASPEATAARKMLWMIKPNRQELAEMVGVPELADEAAVIEAGRRLARRVTWVAVTLGAEGGLLFDGEHIWRGRCDIPAEKVVNTVGCGDAMLAGLIDAQARGWPPERVLQRGLAAGTANALEVGVAQFDLATVEQLEQQTTVEGLGSSV